MRMVACTTRIAPHTSSSTSRPSRTQWLKAPTCGAISCGPCSTTSNGHGASRNGSASFTWTSTPRPARSKTAGWPTRSSSETEPPSLGLNAAEQLVKAIERSAAVRTGVRLEVVTVVWMAVEAVLAIGAGIAARSVLLTAFGFDSVIELLSGVTLLWWLSAEARGSATPHIGEMERRATQISAGLLLLLCGYLVFTGVGGLILQIHPERSVVGVVVSAAAVLVMPFLAWRKRRVNATLASAALRADIAETLTCAYMAAATLAGTALNLMVGRVRGRPCTACFHRHRDQGSGRSRPKLGRRRARRPLIVNWSPGVKTCQRLQGFIWSCLTVDISLTSLRTGASETARLRVRAS